MELCNGNGIRKIMSGVGKLYLIDKMTREICLKKAGKTDFARVLVEVSAEDDLPNVLEIESRTDKEIAAKTIKDAIKLNNPITDDKSNDKDEGFVTVGKKNKPVETQARVAPVRNVNFNGNRYGMKSKGETNGRRQYVGIQKQYGNSQWANVNVKQSNGVGWQKKNSNTSFGTFSIQDNSAKKSLYQTSRDLNFKPKVLVRGFGSKNNSNLVSDETIPIKHTFNVLSSDGDDMEDMGDINVNDEFVSKVWLELREEVDILLEAGFYPSKQVRLDWLIHQMDYFYKNCHKFYLDPICEDDEGDVESDNE
ncbi:hypothetical protein Tco_1222936 [Tanacetum coccineum]